MKSKFSEIRAEYCISDIYQDEVLAAFAEDEPHWECVEWSEFERAYCGTWEGFSENEAIGRYLCWVAKERGELDNIPGYIRVNIEWRKIGKGAKFSYENFNGDLRAVRMEFSTCWAVFRVIDSVLAHRMGG